MRTGIALGSNLGDRHANLAAGRNCILALHEGPAPLGCSSLYETEPVGCAPGTAAFLNAVIEIETTLEPLVLLQKLRDCESGTGRAGDRTKNSPRALDLDILYVGRIVLDSSILVLPHPQMASRRFVLQPLSDIAPALILPAQTATVTQLLSGLPRSPAVRFVAREW